MIEGLILAGELAIFGLLLWNVRQWDGKRPERLGLFNMTESEKGKEEVKTKRKARHA